MKSLSLLHVETSDRDAGEAVGSGKRWGKSFGSASAALESSSPDSDTALACCRVYWGGRLGALLYRALYLDFPRAHAAVFTLLTLLASLVLLAIEGSRSLPWVDCWFTATSALTVTGLGVADTARLLPGSKAVILSLVSLGGQVSFALVPLCLRRIQASRRRRGGVAAPPGEALEARALRVLMLAFFTYGLFWSLLGWAVLGGHCALNARAHGVLAERGLSAAWFGLFTAVSAFNNAGLSLLSDSLVPFADDVVVVLTVALLITAGITLLPVFLRCALRALHLALRARGGGATSDAVALLLERPRLFTTHMFESGQSWWLFLLWLATTVVQWVVYSAVPLTGEQQPQAGTKILNMFSTTISTRTAGFNVINLNTLEAGVLVLQLLLMYLSSYPLIVAVKSSQETEMELGMPMPAHTAAPGQADAQQRTFVSQLSPPAREARKVLSEDLTWLALGGWLIAISNPWLDIATLFRLLWEVVSAFGNVGTSLALPTDVASFSGGLNDFGKLVVVAIMIAGRHRGMPHSLDAATVSVRPPMPIGRLESQRDLVRRLEQLTDSRLRRRRVTTRMDGSRRLDIDSTSEIIVLRPEPARPHVADAFHARDASPASPPAGPAQAAPPAGAAQAAPPAGPAQAALPAGPDQAAPPSGPLGMV